MPSQVTVTGVAGSLCWGYHQAAALGAWTVTKTADGWALTATVVTVDPFRCAQRPLVFVAPHQDGSWRWPIVEVSMTPGALSARLGPKE